MKSEKKLQGKEKHTSKKLQKEKSNQREKRQTKGAEI